MRMTALIVVCVCVQVLIVALILPIGFAVTAHFSLESEAVVAQVKVAGISVARIKIGVKDGLKVQINGKTIKNRKPQISASGIKNVCGFLYENKIVDLQGLIAYVGANDAKNGAILCAIVKMLPLFSKTVVEESGKARFDAECGIKVRISVAQAVKAIATAKEG